MSLGVHGYVRATEVVDVIVTREGLARFKERWIGRGYVNLWDSGKPIRDTENNVRVDFLIAGDYPGDGKPKPVAIPEPRSVAIVGDKYRVISLKALIELKLASGMSAPHRGKDLVDVQELITAAKLPESLVEQLDPSVREKYRELWKLAQHTDDEY